ncbi:hypothetical protein QQ045_005744 [Rhodiola kirilowii]
MVSLESSISVRESPPVANPNTPPMSNSNHVNPTNPNPKSRNRKTPNSIGGQKIQSCDQWQFVFVDILLLIAVVTAVGCLLFPYAKVVILSLVGIVGVGFSLVKEEISYAPALYGSLALGMLCAGLAILFLLVFTDTNCGKPGCKGLRKAAAFDVQVQTEEALRNSSNGSSSFKDVVKVGMARFRREHLRELEARLRKMAPHNGKAVLLYRSKCGCIAGKMEVAGPRTLQPRGKIKK